MFHGSETACSSLGNCNLTFHMSQTPLHGLVSLPGTSFSSCNCFPLKTLPYTFLTLGCHYKFLCSCARLGSSQIHCLPLSVTARKARYLPPHPPRIFNSFHFTVVHMTSKDGLPRSGFWMEHLYYL